MIANYLALNMSVRGIVVAMTSQQALRLSLMRNTLGQKEFPDIGINGGTIEGIPVITSENIVATGRVGTLFMVPGFDESLRVNGRAVLSTDPADLALCADARRTPVLAIRVTVESVYLHCGKALMRSQLWDASRRAERAQMPSMGEMLRDQIRAFKGEEIEAETQAQMLERYRQSL